jgi:hypothetical protein
MLRPNGFPEVLLPVAGLRSQAAYEAVIARAKQHAAQFGS